MDEELDKIFLPLAEAESGEYGNALTGKLAFTDAPLTVKARAKVMQLIKQARIAEVDRYADYLTDMETEAAFEMGYGEYAYKRIREIDAEGGAPMA